MEDKFKHFSETMILSFQENALPKSRQKSNSKSNSNSSSNKILFQYGNYRGYYGYRKNDHRLDFLKMEWIHNRTCLDIGCNSGKVTLEISIRLKPFSIVGIDLDEDLITSANETLKKRQEKSSKPDPKTFPISFSLVYGPLNYYPFNISFQRANILECELKEENYETIICLSTTKWIHLNWGDAGIKKLFQQVSRGLTKGGYFILEPQLYPSYKKKKSLTPEIRANYEKIELYPENFVDYLKTQHSFLLIETIYPFYKSTEDPSSAFDRPIFVLQKPNLDI